ncbi:MAG: TetR/AcrR family transcriptional regulator [Roseiflexaceae bacterium]
MVSYPRGGLALDMQPVLRYTKKDRTVGFFQEGMMGKGDQTRQRIIERAAGVFNTQGFSGASLGALTQAAGIEKGGLYNHFASKEQLALEAFDYASGLIAQRFQAAMAGKTSATERLLALVGVFERYMDDPPLPGGCPVVNTAVEADDAIPALRERARAAMTSWHKLIGSTVKAGVVSGELRAEADPYAVATLLTATLEGALLLSRLYDDPAHMRRAAEHLAGYLHSLAASPPSPHSEQGATP